MGYEIIGFRIGENEILNRGDRIIIKREYEEDYQAAAINFEQVDELIRVLTMIQESREE